MPPNTNPTQRSSPSSLAASASVPPLPPPAAVRRSRPAAAAAAATAPRIDDDAVLKLVPLSPSQCRSLLSSKGIDVDAAGTSSNSNCEWREIVLKLKLSPARTPPRADGGPREGEPSVHLARRFADGSVAASAVLGRREATGIKLQSVSRALCEVTFSGVAEGGARDSDGPSPGPEGGAAARLSMRKAPRQHSVHLDGVPVSEPPGRRIELKDGSVISLWGPLGFAYLVRFGVDSEEGAATTAADAKSEANVKSEGAASIGVECEGPANQKSEQGSTGRKRKAPPSPSPHREIRKRSHQLMVGEQTCALCMDILIKSTFAYPCGHAFCGECKDSCNDTCPNCRSRVDDWMPARSFDTIIWATALQGCFDPDDAKAYLERRRESGEPEPTAHERECILGTAARTDGDNGYCLPSQRDAAAASATTVPTMPPSFPPARSFGGGDPVPFCGVGGGSVRSRNHSTATPRPNPNDKRGSSASDAICLDSP